MPQAMHRNDSATSRLGLFMTARAVHYNATPPVSLQEQVKQGIDNQTGYINVFQCETRPKTAQNRLPPEKTKERCPLVPIPPPLPPPPFQGETVMRTSAHSPAPLGDLHTAGQPLHMQTSSTPQQGFVRAHGGFPNISAVNATARRTVQHTGAPPSPPKGDQVASVPAIPPIPRAVADATGPPFPYRPNLQTKPLDVAHVDVAHQHHLLPVPVVPSPQIIPAVPPPSSTGRAKSTVKQDLVHRRRKAGHPYHRMHVREDADASMPVAAVPRSLEARPQALHDAHRVVEGRTTGATLQPSLQDSHPETIARAHRGDVCTAESPRRTFDVTRSGTRPSTADGKSSRPQTQIALDTPTSRPRPATNEHRADIYAEPTQPGGPYVCGAPTHAFRYQSLTGPAQLCPAHIARPPSYNGFRCIDMDTRQAHPVTMYGDSGDTLGLLASRAAPTPSPNPREPLCTCQGVDIAELLHDRHLAEDLHRALPPALELESTCSLSDLIHQQMVNMSLRHLHQYPSGYSALQGALSLTAGTHL